MQTHNLLGRRVVEIMDPTVTGTVVAAFLDNDHDVQLLVEFDECEHFEQGDTGRVEALAMRLLPVEDQGSATSDGLDDLETLDDDNWIHGADNEEGLEVHCELDHDTRNDVLYTERSCAYPDGIYIGVVEAARSNDSAGVVLRAPSARKLAWWILANTPLTE